MTCIPEIVTCLFHFVVGVYENGCASISWLCYCYLVNTIDINLCSVFWFGSRHCERSSPIPVVRDGKRKSLVLENWAEVFDDEALVFVLFHMAMKEEQNSHQRDAHLVLHGSSSWLFIRRRGRLCRRWMFLWTTRGTCSTCRFSAVVSWVELLIDFGSTIFSRIYWKVQDAG